MFFAVADYLRTVPDLSRIPEGNFVASEDTTALQTPRRWITRSSISALDATGNWKQQIFKSVTVALEHLSNLAKYEILVDVAHCITRPSGVNNRRDQRTTLMQHS